MVLARYAANLVRLLVVGLAPTAQSLLVPPPGPADVWVDFSNLNRAPRAAAVAAAAYQVDIGDANASLQALGEIDSPAAALLRARAWRLQQEPMRAAAALVQARQAPELGPLIDVELAHLAARRGDWPATLGLLSPLVVSQPALASGLVAQLAQAQTVCAPLDLVGRFELLLGLTDPEDPDAKSLLWEVKAQALTRLGRTAEATAARLSRYLCEPVSAATPLEPPAGTSPTAAQLIERIDKMVRAHRNERALAALERLPDWEPPVASPLDPNGGAKGAADAAASDLYCRRAYLTGLAARKQRRYAKSEEQCARVMQHCAAFPELLRQAAFLRAKVISIKDGLRAVPLIDAFVAHYSSHSMADDALFWAGDMYQRRGDLARAQLYYGRIEALPVPGDFCAEARWRTAWMAFRQADFVAAQKQLQRLLLPDGCVRQAEDRARAHYWLGRTAEQLGQRGAAAAAYRQAIDSDAHGFYAQRALPALLGLQDPNASLPLSREMMAPPRGAPPRLCARGLQAQPGFSQALAYLRMGLTADAARQLRALQLTPPDGIFTAADLQACGPAQSTLLLVLLQQEAGADREAYTRLRRSFGENFGLAQSPQHMWLWRAAYPLAFREALARGERQSQLPNLFLQALAREESAFDPKVVSWAEAYGLTQLLLSSARDAGQMLRPPRQVASAESLLDPEFNAELGAALFGSMARRQGNSLALGLVSYNAGGEHAALLRRRFSGKDFMVFAEEVHIAETRAYVKRVLKTFGTYRWLYAMSLPSLPVGSLL